MIGLVVVSHSRRLADAAVDLATQMVHDRDLRIEVAAGLDEETLGTDATAVADAIIAADSGSGVLILMDLGSAILSAELALELLPTQHRIRLCAAPLVEGLVAAAVAAANGAALAETADEADNALIGKRTQLGIDTTPEALPEAVPRNETTMRGSFIVANEHGLHARPAARLIAELRDLDCRIELRNLTTGTGPASGRSLSRIAALGALTGHEIEITASGPAAEHGMNRLLMLARQRFGEEIPALVADHPAPTTSTGPLPTSTGIAIGPAWQPETTHFVLPDHPAGPPATERRLLDDAIARAKEQLRSEIQLHPGREPRYTSPQSEVFQAHLLLLDDDELITGARQQIAGGAAAAGAWATALDTAAQQLEVLPDPYLRARAADIRAVRDQVLGELLGQDTRVTSRPGILVAADLTPAQVAGLDETVVTGIVLAHGSPTSHAAILARAKGIPAVSAAGDSVLRIPTGTTIALDGATGELAIDPQPECLAEFRATAAEQHNRRQSAQSAAHDVAVSRDGVMVHVAANVGSAAEADHAVRAGADLAGLVRTEFLFLGREQAPSVEEQEQVYRDIAKSFDGRRVVLRTLDVGGDKPLPYISQPREANPFLGLRGTRLGLAHPELLRDQLQAIVRVAADYPVSVMFPMITTVEEVRTARRMLGTIAPPDLDIEVGIMVEVPAVAARAAVFAGFVDFFSIGTNDLTQYTLAVERGNESVAGLADPLDPGVLHLIDKVCRGAGDTRVAVCGEAAADPAAVPLLLGLGVSELSVAPPALPLTKAAVRELDIQACRAAAARALACESATQVRSQLARNIALRGRVPTA
ncbi:phosphoenolpyruvate--protein phosphotransferase [Nocardia grenadensis]